MKKIDLPFSIDLMMNKSEYCRLSNTGRFLSLLSHKVKVHIRGLRDTPICYEEYFNSICHKKNYVLFPTSEAKLLSEVKLDLLQNINDINFIVPDGNWSQGAKIAKRLGGYPQLNFIYIDTKKKSNYKLRYNPNPQRLCTLESVAEVFRQILGEDAQQKSLQLLE